MDIQNYIDGKLVPPTSGLYFDNVEPATGKTYSRVPDSDASDLDKAVNAAARAWPVWKQTTAAERGALLMKLADLVEAKREAFERAESVDNGKPLYLSHTVDIARSLANLRNFGKADVSEYLQHFEKDSSSSYTLRQPIGIVSIISPWNLPLLLFTWKLAPALMAGNCVIAKPSEVTPMTAFMLSELLNEAGFPPGVANIIHGKGATIGQAITDHPKITAISFTGGTATGTTIYQGAAKQLKKVSLELGGKNPTIVFADAEFEKSVEATVNSAFANQGQVCLCSERILIERSIYTKFRDAMVERAKNIVIGDPLVQGTQHGATVSEAHMKKILDGFALAEKEGGKLLLGGKRRIVEGRCKDGFFVEPTIFENLPPTCQTNQEELFGPLAVLIPFDTEEEALAIANGTKYGLSASVFTSNDARAKRMAAGIDSGIVWINCWNIRDLDTPFGGMKKSGIGREGKQRALEFFTEEKQSRG